MFEAEENIEKFETPAAVELTEEIPTEIAATEEVAAPVSDEAALDAALDAQGEVEPEVVEEIPAQAEPAPIQEQLDALKGRVSELERRLEDHNVRSGHKI